MNDTFDGLAARGGMKACVLAYVSFLALWLYNGKVFVSILIATAFFSMGLFATWRRYLEPIGVVLLLFALVTAVEPSLLNKVHFALQ
ncbi:hypothetical protein J2R76_000190 [Bradyrhizobium sp. USDA 4532]|uniref:hypothetical protein n=1 Tax=unclassified Bradyrhizobium TaxID=2631580 RepID=UPI00209EBE08|nr:MULTISPECIES: hypothetical protein [unclassified Bradyrhizobium]MCP1831763.1 hypothetical protein [Bradyrhizobium sp. USDA 4545]MCP1916599.1 hypothetical protein [Bradyrhizobium sp. USDA 4532]